MGEAKRRIQIQEHRANAQVAAAKYVGTIPSRLVKAIVGVTLFPFLVWFSFTVHCFKRNKWPWDPAL